MRARPVLGYFVLTCALSWGLLAVFLGMHGRWGTAAAMPVAVLYMFGPALAAAILQRRAERPLSELGVSLRPRRSWIVAWALPVIVAAATLGLGFALPSVHFDPSMTPFFARLAESLSADQVAQTRAAFAKLPVHPALLAAVQAALIGPTLNAVVAFGEELGWRGYLFEALRGVGFWRSSALVGLMWGVWHAPIILLGHNYPEHPQAGVSLMIVFCVLWAPLFAWVRERSGSVGAPSVLHGTLNALAGVPLMVTQGGSDLLVGMTGAVGLGVVAVANLVLFVARRRGPDPG
jgi:membrane protease YdiL (CAAX protease family)